MGKVTRSKEVYAVENKATHELRYYLNADDAIEVVGQSADYEYCGKVKVKAVMDETEFFKNAAIEEGEKENV